MHRRQGAIILPGVALAGLPEGVAGSGEHSSKGDQQRLSGGRELAP